MPAPQRRRPGTLTNVSFIVSVSNEPLRRMAAGVCLLASLPALAFAQTAGGDPAEEARMHLGPLALTPRFRSATWASIRMSSTRRTSRLATSRRRSAPASTPGCVLAGRE